MRMKYYTKSLKRIHLNRKIVFVLIVIITVTSTSMYMYNKAVPMIESICKTRAKAIALEVTNKSVIEGINNIKYDDLVSLKQDSTGRIIAINADVMELNRISTSVSSDILNRLLDIESRKVTIPLTTLFSMGLLSGYGPGLPLNIIPMGDVTSKFKSEFTQAGINQTRHRIYIEVVTRVRLISPFYTASQEYINEVTVAESIIVGDTPSTYYNINGMEGKDKFQIIK